MKILKKLSLKILSKGTDQDSLAYLHSNLGGVQRKSDQIGDASRAAGDEQLHAERTVVLLHDSSSSVSMLVRSLFLLARVSFYKSLF